MFSPGDILTYTELCVEEKAHLQRGMNYRLRGGTTVVLMSQRKNAPYADRIEDDGKTLIYEGHNIQANFASEPDKVDQPTLLPNGAFTQNGLFHAAAQQYKNGEREEELIKVYEKLRDGIWVYNGLFKLVDSWQEKSGSRLVWKFRLTLTDEVNPQSKQHTDLEHSRLIPAHIKQLVWKRDGGKCVLCNQADNLHFDHIIPFAKGGSSLVAENIQLLCARHNLSKHDSIA